MDINQFETTSQRYRKMKAEGFEIIKVEDKKGQVSENFDSWLAGLKKQAKIWQFIK